jgi:hypothetical protein
MSRNKLNIVVAQNLDSVASVEVRGTFDAIEATGVPAAGREPAEPISSTAAVIPDSAGSSADPPGSVALRARYQRCPACLQLQVRLKLAKIKDKIRDELAIKDKAAPKWAGSIRQLQNELARSHASVITMPVIICTSSYI